MQTSATIIKDSINEFGNRLITYELIYPRIIHAELLTHRLFSKNSASSRAIPFVKMVESVKNAGFVPMAFQKSHSGMQGNEYFKGQDLDYCIQSWNLSKEAAIYNAETLYKLGVTKQLCNRILEPFSYIKVVLTASEYDNFFDLRCPKYYGVYKSQKDLLVSNVEERKRPSHEVLNKGMAEIHLMDLAEKMWDARNESKPQQLKSGQWHIPYEEKINDEEIRKAFSNLSLNDIKNASLLYTNRKYESSTNDIFAIGGIKLKISTMMCARTSYTTVDVDQSVWGVEKYIQKYDEMYANKHKSPFEHVQQAMSSKELNTFTHERYTTSKEDLTKLPINCEVCTVGDEIIIRELGWCDNIRGFIPLRHKLEYE